MAARQPLAPAQRDALRSAAQWYALLSSGMQQARDQQRWQQWHDADPLHQQAWQQVEEVRQLVAGVPAEVAVTALQQSRQSRRQVLRQLLVLAGVGAVGWSGARSDLATSLLATHHTGVGEQRALVLADGSQVLLDSQSALDVRFDDQRRLLHLHSGRMLVQTAADVRSRPFWVTCAQGQVEALGTCFSVQADKSFCEVAVLDKAVRIHPAQSPQSLRLEAGQHVRFDPHQLSEPSPSDASTASWRTGNLIAIKRPLGELLEELGRYRHGWLRCDPSIAALKVSGAFPLVDTDRALAALESGFDLRIERRSRYWVSVMPKPA
ncbi:FecR domain-containing protein [Pseudomonas plecoglossicida]|uniref:FecR domain-containing protein n=1 Tax=Pseudomonas plecoglossicida TaxID=70775 RepID=UPI0021597A65|nr:FecR domain-containing protein [Pseudomonas plecoglossicida]